jgi:predicted  nucleic acid-binding Zn-ribbon protein
MNKPKKCPKCGKTYTDHPAMSRVDNKTEICPECGTREALDVINMKKVDQDKIIAEIQKLRNNI